MSRYEDFESRILAREETLSSYVDNLTTGLRPNRNYRISLEGMPLSQHTFLSLEQYFGRTLDPKADSTVVLRFNEEQDKFTPVRLSLPLEKSSAKATLFHNRTHGYQPAITEPNDKQIFTGNMPIASSSDLLAELSITQPPVFHGEEYALWRDGLIGRSTAWDLSEEVELTPEPHEITDSLVTAIILRNHVRGSRGEIQSIRSISRKMTVYPNLARDADQLESSEGVLKEKPPLSRVLGLLRVTIEKHTDVDGSTLTVYKERGSCDPNDLFAEDTYEKKGMVPLDEDNFPLLVDIAESAMQKLRSQQLG